MRKNHSGLAVMGGVGMALGGGSTTLGLRAGTTFVNPGGGLLTGLLIAVLAFVVLVGIGGAFVVIVVANRAEPDPTGRRPFVVYLFGIAFITVFTALMGSTAIIASLVQLIGSHPRILSTSIHPVGDAAARGVVLGGLIVLVSLATFFLHVRKAVDLSNSDADPAAPAKRAARSYVSAVAFVSVLILVISLVAAIYAIFAVAGPGVFGSHGRTPAVRLLLDAAYLAIASAVILLGHLRMSGPLLWPWKMEQRPRAPLSEAGTSGMTQPVP